MSRGAKKKLFNGKLTKEEKLLLDTLDIKKVEEDGISKICIDCPKFSDCLEAEFF